MAQTAVHLVGHVIPHVLVRQWVLIWVMRLPIPLRLLLAAQPKLVTPVLQVVHRVITRHLLGQAGRRVDEADEADEANSGAVTLIQPNFHDWVSGQPQRPPALPGAGRRVPARHRLGAGIRRRPRARRGSAAGGAAQDHHRHDAGQRTRANQRRGPGGAEAQDALARWHHAPGDAAAGVHAAAGGKGDRRAPFGRSCHAQAHGCQSSSQEQYQPGRSGAKKGRSNSLSSRSGRGVRRFRARTRRCRAGPRGRRPSGRWRGTGWPWCPRTAAPHHARGSQGKRGLSPQALRPCLRDRSALPRRRGKMPARPPGAR